MSLTISRTGNVSDTVFFFSIDTQTHDQNTYLTGITVREEIPVNLFEFFYWQMSARTIFQEAFIPFLNFGIWKCKITFKNIYLHIIKFQIDLKSMGFRNLNASAFKTYRWIRCFVSNLLRLLAWVYCFVFPCWWVFCVIYLRVAITARLNLNNFVIYSIRT